MIKSKTDSIKKINKKMEEEMQRGADIELLKGCIMELAGVIYADPLPEETKGAGK